MSTKKLAENAMLRLSNTAPQRKKRKVIAASQVNPNDIQKYLDAMENRITDGVEAIDITTGFYDEGENGIGEFIWHDAPRNAKEFILKAIKEANTKVNAIKDAQIISEGFEGKDYKVEIQFA